MDFETIVNQIVADIVEECGADSIAEGEGYIRFAQEVVKRYIERTSKSDKSVWILYRPQDQVRQ